MREVYSDIEIKATPDRVWDVATDFESFPDWNPFLRSAKGELKAGGRLEIEVQTGAGKHSRMQPTVLKSDRPSEFRWNVRQAFGMFNREFATLIQPSSEERVRVIQRCMFTGMLVPFMGGAIEETKLGFDAMNEALRAKAERTEN